MTTAKLDADSVRSPEFRAWYLRLMKELVAQGSEIAASNKNATFFCDLLGSLVAANKGAVIGAYSGDGVMVGFGGAYSTGFDAAAGGQVWTALGTYVDPEHRGNGYAGQLRSAALLAAKKAGASCATAGRYIGQNEGLHASMKPIQTLYMVTL